MKITPLPSQARLKELLDYDPLTGGLVWRNPPANLKRMKGKSAGTFNTEGYRKICIGGRPYKAHRIIWLWQTGVDPLDQQVDHKDQDKANNAWSNLRLATSRQNRSNRFAKSRELPKGVSVKRQRYLAQIMVNYVNHYLGTFDTPEEAHQAYCEAAVLLHGEFVCLE